MMITKHYTEIPIHEIDQKLNSLKLIITDSADSFLLNLLRSSDLNIEVAIGQYFSGNIASSENPTNSCETTKVRKAVSSAMAVASPIIIPATKPILIKGLGPVDTDNYPIYNPIGHNEQKKENDIIKRQTNLDQYNNNICLFKDNDKTLKANYFAENKLNDDERDESEKWKIYGSLKPGTSSNTCNLEYDALHFYGLVDAIRPYHLDDEEQIPDGMIWVSGCTVATMEEANHQSIDEKDPLYRIHEPGYFKCGEIVEYYLNEEGLKRLPFDSELVERGRGRIFATHNKGEGEQFSGWRFMDLEPGHFLVEKVKRNSHNRDWYGWLEAGDYNIDPKLYHILRVNDVTPSPLRQLFFVKVTPESSYMAWKLRDILIDLGIATDWLTVNIIAEYLPLSYQRDIYFDFKRFERVVTEGRKSTEVLIRKMSTDLRRRQPDDDVEYYQSKILEIGQQEIATDPHPLLSQNAHLPQISPSGRGHIGIVSKRLDLVLKASTNLYGYQLHTVLWCHELERSILAKQTMCIGSNDLRFCSGSNCAVYVKEDGTYSSALKPRAIEPRIIKYGGGVISDDVGLGKTLTMLSLIAAHPHRDDITANSFLPNSEELEFGPNGDTIRCAATLVVAPPHLIHQWKDEIDRHFKENTFNVITICELHEHQKLTYRDLLEAHVVLVSASFLRIKWSTTSNEKKPKVPIDILKQHTLRRSRRTRKGQNREDDPEGLSKKGPYLHLLHWRRFVLDEGHELLSSKSTNTIRSNIYDLSSDFVWYCTATPFPSPMVMNYAGTFLDIRLNDEYLESTNQKGSNSILQNVIYQHLYSKHTKESIATDNHLPEIEEICKFVQLHPIERVLYDAVTMLKGTEFENPDLERAICSGALKHIECGLFKSWRHRLLYLDDDISLRLDVARADDDNLEADYLGILLRLNRKNVEYVLNQIHRDEEKIGILRNRRIPEFERYAKEYDEMKEQFQRENKKWETDKAWKKDKDRERHVTAHRKLAKAHKKIALWEEGMRIWPAIQSKLHEDIEDEETQFEAKVATAPRGDVLLELYRRYGSKQALLLEFVLGALENRNNRIIIFSLFGELLSIIKKRLKLVGVKAGIVRGRAGARRKAMRAFQTEISDDDDAEKRVILLSSKAAASGADLKLATHIILTDPVPGSASEAFAVERQAIGRAVRQGMDQRGTATKVVRFVVRNTIEQETHERNQEVREQDDGMNRDLMQMPGTKMEDRTRDEIDFFMNIREYAEQSKKVGDPKRDKAQNAIVTVSRKKRPRSTVVKKETNSLPDNEDVEMEEPPKKRRRVKQEKHSDSSDDGERPSEPVYCVCRRPDGGDEFMIQCDRCEEWYHGKCIGVTEAAAEEIEEYECSLCSGKSGKREKE